MSTAVGEVAGKISPGAWFLSKHLPSTESLLTQLRPVHTCYKALSPASPSYHSGQKHVVSVFVDEEQMSGWILGLILLTNSWFHPQTDEAPEVLRRYGQLLSEVGTFGANSSIFGPLELFLRFQLLPGETCRGSHGHLVIMSTILLDN